MILTTFVDTVKNGYEWKSNLNSYTNNNTVLIDKDGIKKTPQEFCPRTTY